MEHLCDYVEKNQKNIMVIFSKPKHVTPLPSLQQKGDVSLLEAGPSIFFILNRPQDFPSLLDTKPEVDFLPCTNQIYIFFCIVNSHVTQSCNILQVPVFYSNVHDLAKDFTLAFTHFSTVSAPFLNLSFVMYFPLSMKGFFF